MTDKLFNFGFLGHWPLIPTARDRLTEAVERMSNDPRVVIVIDELENKNPELLERLAAAPLEKQIIILAEASEKVEPMRLGGPVIRHETTVKKRERTVPKQQRNAIAKRRTHRKMRRGKRK